MFIVDCDDKVLPGISAMQVFCTCLLTSASLFPLGTEPPGKRWDERKHGVMQIDEREWLLYKPALLSKRECLEVGTTQLMEVLEKDVQNWPTVKTPGMFQHIAFALQCVRIEFI